MILQQVQKTKGFADFKPNHQRKGHPQKHGGIAYELPREDKKQSLRLGRVVEAG